MLLQAIPRPVATFSHWADPVDSAVVREVAVAVLVCSMRRQRPRRPETLPALLANPPTSRRSTQAGRSKDPQGKQDVVSHGWIRIRKLARLPD